MKNSRGITDLSGHIRTSANNIYSMLFSSSYICNDQCWNVLLSEVLPITWHFSNIVFKQDLNVKWLCCVLHDNRLTSVIVNSSIHSDTTVTFLTQIKCYIHIYLSIYIYTHITFDFIHELSHYWFLIFSAIFLTIFFRFSNYTALRVFISMPFYLCLSMGNENNWF